MITEIRGYSNLQHIASGGFGQIYVGHHERTNREVAIKVMLLPQANRQNFLERFEFEAALIAHLEHPHIVPIYDYWHDAKGAYLVMRYVRGGTLASRLAYGAIELDTVASILDQVASALDVAHRNHIVHQDIKPANILLDEDDNAYLTDFGIARDMDGDVNMAFDGDKHIHGSPKYIAPEHLRRQKVTPKSDIYSLGITIFEALTGRPPFDSEDVTTILQHHIHSELPEIQKLRPGLPSELNVPMQKATAKDPEARYDTVLGFAHDVQKVVADLRYMTV